MKAVKNVVLVILIISLIGATALLIRNNSVNALAQDVSNLQSDTNSETVEGLGDVNRKHDGSNQRGDGSVNAVDASEILIIAAEMNYAKINKISYELDEEIKNRADVNMDGNIDHIDASFVLKYGAEAGAGTTDKDFADWMKEKTTEEQSN